MFALMAYNNAGSDTIVGVFDTYEGVEEFLQQSKGQGQEVKINQHDESWDVKVYQDGKSSWLYYIVFVQKNRPASRGCLSMSHY